MIMCEWCKKEIEPGENLCGDFLLPGWYHEACLEEREVDDE